MGAPTGVRAQDDAAYQIEEIVTTGSRIKRADLDSASPVAVISQDDILVTGITDVGDLLQRLPSMSGSPIGTTTNNGGKGAVLVDLRGFGTVRTLTLVDGRRVVDYQTIPSKMIERVEILKDGASAVYGADAVAGVVNIITRKDFEGVEFSAQTAEWLDTEADAHYSFSIGVSTQCARFNFNPFNYYQTPQERWQATAVVSYDYNDYVELYGRTTFSNNSSAFRIAPSGTFGQTFTIPIMNPFFSDATRATIITDLNSFATANASAGDPLGFSIAGIVDVNNDGVFVPGRVPETAACQLPGWCRRQSPSGEWCLQFRRFLCRGNPADRSGEIGFRKPEPRSWIPKR